MKNIILVIFILLLVLFSCKRHVFNKIEFDESSVFSVKDSMELIVKLLDKTNFDTIAIKNERIQGYIDSYDMYSDIYSIDSVRQNLDSSKFNFQKKIETKELSRNIDSTISFNGRMYENYQKFKKSLFNCKETSKLNNQEKLKLLKLYNFLNNNNIHSFVLLNYSYIVLFTFKKQYDHAGNKFERYLILKSQLDTLKRKGEFLEPYIILDEKDGLILLKRKELPVIPQDSASYGK